MKKTFAWLLFGSSVICFAMQFRAQQLAIAADELRQELDSSAPAHRDLWQTAAADDSVGY